MFLWAPSENVSLEIPRRISHETIPPKVIRNIYLLIFFYDILSMILPFQDFLYRYNLSSGNLLEFIFCSKSFSYSSLKYSFFS